MRYIKDIPNSQYKISIYQWNNKYIIKLEAGMLEQTYKIEEYEVSSLDEIEKAMDDAFINRVTQTFQLMQTDFADTLTRNEIIF